MRLKLEPAHLALERAGIALDVARGGLIVLALGQLEQLARIVDGLGDAIELLDLCAVKARALAPELLRALGLDHSVGILQLAADLLETFFLAIVLKETPVRR